MNAPPRASALMARVVTLLRARAALGLLLLAECIAGRRSVTAREGLRGAVRPRTATPADRGGNGPGEERKYHLTFAPLFCIFLTTSRGALRVGGSRLGSMAVMPGDGGPA